MNRFILLLLISQISLCSFAQSLSESFPAGKGASYVVRFNKNPKPVNLSIYVAATRVDSVHIEYFLEVKDLLPVQLWQQFEIGVRSGHSAEVRRGYVFAKELPRPEIIPSEYLRGAAGGIQVNDFLFASKDQLEKHKVGDEIVEISAGTTKATHYRTSNNGQTVDYWIADQARPLGLVMLVSKSEKDENQNFSLELTGILENVKPKINSEQAVELSPKGKAFLAKPQSVK